MGRKGRPVPGASTEGWSCDQPSSASLLWAAVPAPRPASDQSKDRSGWGGDSNSAGGGKSQQFLMWTEEMLLPCPFPARGSHRPAGRIGLVSVQQAGRVRPVLEALMMERGKLRHSRQGRQLFPGSED